MQIVVCPLNIQSLLISFLWFIVYNKHCDFFRVIYVIFVDTTKENCKIFVKFVHTIEGLVLSRFGIMRLWDWSYCCHLVTMRKEKWLKIELSWGKYGWAMEPRQCMTVTSLVPLINLCLHLGFLFLFYLWHFGLGSLLLGTRVFWLTHDSPSPTFLL